MNIIPFRKRSEPEPERHLTTLQDEFNRLFGDFFNRTMDVGPLFGGERRPSLSLDVAETDDQVIVTAEVPGIKAEEVDISLRDNVLTIKGEKKHEAEEKGKDYHRIERAYGSFSRAVTLPSYIDPDKIDATSKDGVLTITVGKKAEAKPKTIRVLVKE
jgi:HSP20 family protein